MDSERARKVPIIGEVANSPPGGCKLWGRPVPGCPPARQRGALG
jgi:hypothetical protein